MKKRLFYSTCIIFIFFTIAAADDFSGKYVFKNDNSEVTLTLKSDGKGGYRGSLKGSGNAFNLQGVVQNGQLMGSVGEDEDNIVFQAELRGDDLMMIMVETDDDKNLLPETAQTLIFQRRAEVKQSAAPKNTPADKNKVIINSVVLTEQQVTEIEKKYGIKPRPGKYWYDSVSGLYGVAGYPAYGFMFAGHNFGKLDHNASNGSTGVVVNGRQLPQSEWAVWSYMLGYWIQPGAYWLDHNGNACYQGNPIALVNLFVAAQQNVYRGKGGSGDNFWSTRFGAGNYDSGNQRGYVSVPGHGPIGYGF